MSDFKQGEVLEFHMTATPAGYYPIHDVTFVAEARGWCFVIDGTEPKLVREESLLRPTFKPGLFRLDDKVSMKTLGQQVHWFDVQPNEMWVRVT